MEDIAQVQTIQIENEPVNTGLEEKEFYTIEDLVTIYALHEKGEKQYKNLKQDCKALELKLENLKSKVRNANQYIEEIDKHKRSIFEFWKFANKDEKLAIEMGDEKDEETNAKEMKKSFDLEMDFEKLGEEVDLLQRKKLSHEETDSIFIAQTELLGYLNMLRSNKMVKYDMELILEQLKEDFNEDRLVIDNEAFDIFGNIEEANNKVKYIGSRSHREVEKNKFKIMNINKKIDVFDFTEKMQSIVNYLEGAMPKITSKYDMPLYKLEPISRIIQEDDFTLYNMDVEKELLEFEEDDEGAYNLICLNYQEDMPLLYASNIIFFDNTNKTLPLGMNLSSKVLVDHRRLEFSLTNKTKFRTNAYFGNNGNTPKCKDIFVYEYDVFLKNEKKQEEELVETNDFPMNDESQELALYENIEGLDDLDDLEEFEKFLEDEPFEEEPEQVIPEEPVQNPVRPETPAQESVVENEKPEEPVLKKSRKLMKLQQKLTREMEKEQRREEKARQRLEKKGKKGK